MFVYLRYNKTNRNYDKRVNINSGVIGESSVWDRIWYETNIKRAHKCLATARIVRTLGYINK